MPENNKKRINENKNNSYEDARIIVSSDDEKKIVDFIDFVKTSTNTIAMKLNELLEKYLTEKELLAIYENSMTELETSDDVDKTLNTILKNTAKYISENNNGIKLDSRGNYLDKASKKSAIDLGMADSKDYVDWNASNKFIDDLVKEKKVSESIKVESLGEVLFGSLLGRLYSGESIEKEIGHDIDNFLNKDIEKMNLSESVKDIVREDRDIIKKDKYEHDMHLYRISILEYRIEMAKATNSPILQQLLSERKAFYDEHSEYIGKVPIRKANKELDYDEAQKMLQFGEVYQREFIINHFEEVNGMTQEDFEKVSSREKEHFYIAALVGLGYEKKSNPKYREIAFESKKILRQLNPNLDIEDKKSLEQFFKDQLHIKESNASLDDIIENITRKFEYAIDEYIMNHTEFYKDGNPDFTRFEFEVSDRINHESVFENYFEGSKIKFNENDEDLYNRAYRDSTIDAWIENKDDSIKLRYMALLAVKEEYEQMPDNIYAVEKLNKINKDLEKYHKYLGGIEVTPEEKEFFEGYKKQFINAGIMKYLTRDAFEWQNGVNYEDLKKDNKKGYIRNILSALEYNGDNNVSIKKMALRRLELMNTPDKRFIEFDDQGGYVINKEEILKEYKTMSNFDYKNFDDLLESIHFRENEYLLRKLEEYTNLRDDDFLRLPDRENPIGCMSEINRVRILSNQERIEGKKITDDDFFAALGKGKVAEEDVDVTTTYENLNINNERAEALKNQEEAGNNDATGSERKLPAIEVEIIDASATKEKTPKFMNIINNVWNIVKKFVSKHIKGEEEQKLLDSAEAEQFNNLNGGNVVNDADKTNDVFRRVETPVFVSAEDKKFEKDESKERNDGR